MPATRGMAPALTPAAAIKQRTDNGGEAPRMIEVEVVYAAPAQQSCAAVSVPPGTTLRGAIQASGVLPRGADLEAMGVGVFGRLRGLDESVSAGDRVELYRPLQADPKQARRQRVRAKKRQAAVESSR